jgi:CxxC-x17-CxxC domain-containing protein
MSDRTLTCRDCGRDFVFTVGEQAFDRERGYSEPQRCPGCRAARKSQGPARGYAGDGFTRDGGSGGGGGYRQRYPAVCASCGKETEVPFQPLGDRPVYCRECFQQRRAASPQPGSRRY